ncbi:MAG: hypothetical protein KH195_10260, partial [Clostridiaceae bacterium]|nr:hypothetical protein [Clostridiaceae bacterium]
QYIKPKAVCQELFSSFFSFFRRALPQLVYYTICPSTLSSPPSPFLSITTFVMATSKAFPHFHILCKNRLFVGQTGGFL